MMCKSCNKKNHHIWMVSKAPRFVLQKGQLRAEGKEIREKETG